MALTVQQKLECFKCILECFVAALEWTCNRKTNKDAAIKFPGFDKYVKPHLDNNTMLYNGVGQSGENIQNLIAPWANLADEGDEHFVAINVFGPNPKSKATYLNWNDTWVNIKAQWYHDDSSDTDRIGTLYVCHEPTSQAQPDLTMTLNELGLFDGNEPNDNLKRFWDEFKSRYDNYDWDAKGPQESNNEEESDDDELFDALDNLLWRNKNLILTGAPGTGKTYLAKELAKWYSYDKDDVLEPFRFKMVQFHPSYDYTDFIEGLRPVSQTNGLIGFERRDGVFKEFCKTAIKHQDKYFVFIIDEINRGDINKIFGEVFSAIDPSYRVKKNHSVDERDCVETQYQNLIVDDEDPFKNGFYVPDNVFVIGTMNDIDRSVESLDYAFRRRFAWREIAPAERFSMLEEENLELAQQVEADPTVDFELTDERHGQIVNDLKNASFYNLTTSYCSNLNKEICKEPFLGSKYQIGPAYFLKTLQFIDFNDSITEEHIKSALNEVWNIHLEPVLREYLRGKSEEKIQEIINKLKESYNNN